jgi:adenylate kinase family enzyme
MDNVNGLHHTTIPPLNELGNRICIIGMSASGKSTLAAVLSKKLHRPVCYLDTIAHIPNTAWVPKNKTEFKKDHDMFLQQHAAWIIEGNYQFLMPQRFEYATSIIWLDYPALISAYRHMKRALINPQPRFGNLPGATKQFQWRSIHHILFQAPKNRSVYAQHIQTSRKPLIYIRSNRMLQQLYNHWDLNSTYESIVDDDFL